MSEEINAHYVFRPLTIVGVLTGSIVLLADLIRLLNMPLRVGVVQARSYRGASTTRGDLTINTESLPDIGGRDVLVVDDIFDTGHTLDQLLERRCNRSTPRSVRSAVLLRKRGRQEMSRSPTTWRSRFPTSSSWATGSTTTTPIATCRTSRRSSPTRSPPGRAT